WYATGELNGEPYEYEFTGDTIISEDLVVKAKWKDKSEMLPVKMIGFSQKEYYMLYDDMKELEFCVLPFEADSSSLVWSSSDETMATVTNGMVYSKMRTGDVVITARAANGVSASCMVHLLDYRDYVMLQSIKINEPEITVSKGGYARIQVQYFPENAIYYSGPRLASSDNEIVEVNPSGYIRGLKEGTAVVVVYNSYTDPQFCKVTVVDDGRADVLPEVSSVPVPDATPAPPATPTPDVPVEPDVTPIPVIPPEPDVTPIPSATPTPELPIKIEPTKQLPSATTDKKVVKKGTEFVVNGLRYKILTTGGKKTVACIGVKNAAKRVTIPAAVSYKNQTYKVTVIEKNAFSGDKKLTKLIIGRNVTEIGSKAFANCKKLKEVSIKSTVLKKAGKNIFTGTSKLKLSTPKGKKAKYQKLLQL
ncbi:MAG: leucine-rich repeat protein, partial [Lachnospiraceae bacterium]|nr:leucine-rich repeat protein [Lachnospiraceae bacterium]